MRVLGIPLIITASNSLLSDRASPLLRLMEDEACFYFLSSGVKGDLYCFKGTN